MSMPYQDPNVRKMYDDLLKLNLKTLTPDETSETWEIVKLLYKKERSKRIRKTLFRAGIALSASAIVGAIIFQLKNSEQD